MKKLLCLLFSCVLFALSCVSAQAREVPVSAAAYVLYCPDNGKIIFSDNADKQLPMASTTKIMTTLLTLEEAAVDNRVVEFTDEMIAEGSSMYLKKGEKVTLYDLAVGMMMQSGNDAANAAALSVAGSFESFADLMNEKAAAIGMTRTHFVTPSGLDDENHYSTAYDMALLMAYAMQNEDFATITSQTSMEVHFLYPADKYITYPNHNKLLKMYKDCIGGKTGFTDAAGRCLVTAARRDGLTLIAVTLNDRSDWGDHTELYDEGFSRYKAMTVNSDIDSVSVVGGEADSVELNTDELRIVVPADTEEVTSRVCLPSFLYAPIEQDAVIGKIVWFSDGEVLSEMPVKASRSIGQDRRKRSLFTYIKDLLHWHS